MKHVRSGFLNLILGISGLILLYYSLAQGEDKLPANFYIALAIFIICIVISIRFHRCPACGKYLNSLVDGTFDYSHCPRCKKKID